MFLRDSIIRKRKERVVEGLWTTIKESRPCGRSSSLLHGCSLEGHCLWYVRVYSSDSLWGKHWAFTWWSFMWPCHWLLPVFVQVPSAWSEAHSPKLDFSQVFFFASWTALLCNIALWCRTASKSHFRRWN